MTIATDTTAALAAFDAGIVTLGGLLPDGNRKEQQLLIDLLSAMGAFRPDIVALGTVDETS